ncbi:AraC family transcriptional regulator [Acinetobacter sp. ANC 4193]
MPYVETRRACQSRVCYKAHSHATLSIGAVDAGQSNFYSAFTDEVTIQQESLVVIPAHIEHSCNPAEHQYWSYQMLHVDATWLEHLSSEVHFLLLEKMPIPQLKPFVLHDSVAYQAFCQMNRALFDPDVLITEKEQVLIECLTQLLFPYIDWQQLPKHAYFYQHLQRLMTFCQQAQGFLSLQQLAEKIGVSRYVVIRLFKTNLGLTPHLFQLNLKIHQARQVLKTGAKISTLATDLGFSDQSHFHKVFKAHTGVTPKQYQQDFSRTFLQ